jgi:signal transduction histidine kinase
MTSARHLTGILALSQLLQASDLPKRERSWAEAIRGAADHLARLTTLVVDAAKADATGLVLRDEPFSPQELANSVARSLAARGQGKAFRRRH